MRTGFLRVVALCLLALSIAECSPAQQERRFVSWRLEDDLAAFRQEPSSNPERSYRVGELSDALQDPAYSRFLSLLAQAPSAEHAFIYYQVSGVSGIWFFALATESSAGCRIIAVDHDGSYARTCHGFSTFQPSGHENVTRIRDVVVAGLVQYAPGRPPIRTMAIGDVASPIPDGDEFIRRVHRNFLQG